MRLWWSASVAWRDSARSSASRHSPSQIEVGPVDSAIHPSVCAPKLERCHGQRIDAKLAIERSHRVR